MRYLFLSVSLSHSLSLSLSLSLIISFQQLYAFYMQGMITVIDIISLWPEFYISSDCVHDFLLRLTILIHKLDVKVTVIGGPW